MKRDFGQVSTNRLEILESPLTILPGAEPVFTVRVSGDGEIGASPTMKLFKGTKDVSATNLTGALSVSGRNITLKKIVSLTPGDYAFYIYFTDDGIADERFGRFFVPKESA
jgi:hypothetical protein